MNTALQRKTPNQFTLTFQPGVKEVAERYIERENERIAPAKLSLTALINEAVREYVSGQERRDAEGEAA